MAINEFALRIAFANAVGYIAAVWFPIYASPFLKHFPLLPDQEFNFLLGNYILIFMPVIGYLSYKAIISDLPQNQRWFNQRWFKIPFYLVGFSYIDLPFCLPFPNTWIVLVPICFALIITIAVIVHDHNINFDYVYISDKIISESTKLTRINLEYDIWFKLFLTIITGYSVIAFSYFTKLPEMIALITETRYEHWYLFTVFTFAVCLNVIVFLGTLCVEFINKIILIRETTIKIRLPSEELPSPR